MPDHFRQQPTDPMVPRSPPDCPLALVVNESRRRLPPGSPHGKHGTRTSSGRSSSGFSDISPVHSPQQQQQLQQDQHVAPQLNHLNNEQMNTMTLTNTQISADDNIINDSEIVVQHHEEVPLSLVVDKKSDSEKSPGDSGHEGWARRKV